MEEHHWFAWQDPRDVLQALLRNLQAPSARAFTDGKLRLFAVACGRSVLSFCKDERIVAALDTAERSVGARTNAERQVLKQTRLLIWTDDEWRHSTEGRLAKALVAKSPYGAALGASWWAAHLEGESLAAAATKRERQGFILRDIIGNPFRPIAFDHRWRTEHTVGLAAKMYEERDFAAMPILADALQEAGCEDADILTHCREPGVHVRGCWVVDLVLGKV